MILQLKWGARDRKLDTPTTSDGWEEGQPSLVVPRSKAQIQLGLRSCAYLSVGFALTKKGRLKCSSVLNWGDNACWRTCGEVWTIPYMNIGLSAVRQGVGSLSWTWRVCFHVVSSTEWKRFPSWASLTDPFAASGPTCSVVKVAEWHMTVSLRLGLIFMIPFIVSSANIACLA